MKQSSTNLKEPEFIFLPQKIEVQNQEYIDTRINPMRMK